MSRKIIPQEDIVFIMLFALILPFINLILLFGVLLEEPYRVQGKTKLKIFLIYLTFYVWVIYASYCIPPSAVYR